MRWESRIIIMYVYSWVNIIMNPLLLLVVSFLALTFLSKPPLNAYPQLYFNNVIKIIENEFQPKIRIQKAL